MVDIALIVFAVLVPLLLIAFNLIVLARYIDPQAAAGHFLAKIMIVSGGAPLDPFHYHLVPLVLSDWM